MSLLNLVPWWGRAVAVLALIVAVFGFGYVKGSEHEEAKFDAYKADESRQSLAIQTATIAKTQALQLKKDEAVNAAAKRTRLAQENLASARLDADGLRGDLADANRKLSSASVGSLRNRVSALSDVFGRCTAAITELAGHADRLAIERDALIQAWPK